MGERSPLFRCAAIVLAAGQSQRMGQDKLAAPIGGKAMVLHAVDAALAAAVSPVILVCGPDRDRFTTLLDGRAVFLVPNPDHRSGMASSLSRGVAALPGEAEGVVVLLGDMPMVTAEVINALIAHAAQVPDAMAVVPVHGGMRGNPVLLKRGLFSQMAGLRGDVGARQVLRSARVAELPVDDPAILLDIDTPQELAGLSERMG